MDHKLKLMVVDDSPLFRTWLIRSLSEDDRFQVVGYAVNALDAQEKIPLLQPDMLTLDIEMPGMSGIEFLKQLLPVHPIPVILVSSLNLRVFDALEAGAVDFVRKPDEANGLSKEIFLSMLRSKLMVAAASHVHLPSAPADPQAGGIRKVSSLPPARNTFLQKPKIPLGASPETVIAIGASTGGTEAILEVVKNFPADTLLWSSFFVTLVAKKIVLINLCCRPCFIWGSITIITVWTNMIIINVCKFFYLLIECFLCCKLIQICAFILQGIEITLHRCIVVRISCFAHALCHIYRFAEFGKCFGRIL